MVRHDRLIPKLGLGDMSKMETFVNVLFNDTVSRTEAGSGRFQERPDSSRVYWWRASTMKQ
jgi:hypothetical protein